MTELVLDAEQTKILAEATGPVTVRDHDGRELGVLFPSEESDLVTQPSLTPNEVEELRRRLALPMGELRTTAEVLERLRALDQAE